MKFAPALELGETMVLLPGPIRKFQVQDGWSYDRHKVLLEEGDRTVGSTRNGADISIEGDVAFQGATRLLSELEMSSALESLRELVNGHVGEDLKLYLFQDELGNCRYFERCSVVKLRCDLSEPELYQYQLTIHAGQPSMQETVA